jgi:hypothetical protein
VLLRLILLVSICADDDLYDILGVTEDADGDILGVLTHLSTWCYPFRSSASS